MIQRSISCWRRSKSGRRRYSNRYWQILLFSITTHLLLVSQWSTAAQDNSDQLRVGVLAHFPPHYLTNQQTGMADGFAVDIMDAVAERASVDVDYVVFETWSDLQQALRDKAVDVIPNMGITPEREEWADFTTPVETIPISLFVRSTTNDIRHVDNLPGHRVSVVETNVGVRLMEERQHADLSIHESLDEALLALLSGDSEALVYPQHVLTLLARESGLEERIKLVGEPMLEIKRAIAVSKGDQELLASLDRAVKETIGSEVYREIFAKWYGTPAPFWSIRRVLMAMAAFMGLAIIALVAWRYRTMMAFNKQLAATVSEKEQAQEALERSESRFRMLSENVPGMFGYVGSDRRYQFINKGYEAAFGKPREEILGKTAAELLPADAYERAKPYVDRVLAGEQISFENSTPDPDGNAHWTNITFVPSFDDQGEVDGYFSLISDITDLKCAASALHESEKRFRDFTDSASDWFWETGSDLRFSYVSPRITEVSGINPEDYVGRLRTEVPGNLAESADWQQHLRDLEARRPFRDFTYTRQLSDGRTCHFKINGKPVFDDGGEFLGYRGTGSDITAEIERERRERDAELRLARAVEAVPAAFALFDADDRLVMCNKRQRELYEADLAPLEPGERFEDLAEAIVKGGKIGETPDDARAWLARRLDRKNNPAKGQTFKFGGDRWLSVTDHFLPDGSSIALGIDVTDVKRTEEAVLEREERLRSIIETAPDAIITIDDHGIISTFSRHAEQMFGYEASEMIGENVKVLMPTPYREEHDGYLTHYKETGEKKIIGMGREVVARRKDGSTFPIHLAVNEMMIEGQRLFTGVLRDMTEEKAREEQLRQAQKMEAVGQLTGGVAHDFNNLLTAILGNLEMLEVWHGDDERSEKAISQAQEAAQLGAELTGRLLAFARRQPLEPKVISLSDMVLDINDLLARTLGETIEINTVLANPLDKTLVDPTQVRNALLNLAINARDAMPKGGQLTIETANVEFDEDYAREHADVTAGNYVLLSVSDNGTGMAPDIRDRVFEPFFTTKDVGMGSGMGLSMVYGFIRQSGGHVRLYSEVGQGTAVNLYFPKAEHADSATEKPRAAADMPLAQRETVLVVEDDPRVRQVTLQRLQTLGYSVIEADNGHGALDLLKEAPAVDLVFTDVVMPGGMSGSDLAEEVRRLYPGIKVLLTSGYSEHAGIENGALADEDLWLRKPYKMAELAQKVRDVLEK